MVKCHFHLMGKALVLMLLLIMLPGSHLFAQTKLVTLKVTNASVESVLQKLRTDFSYKLIFNHEEIKNAKTVTLDLKNASIETALGTLLNGTNLTYKLENGVYLILPRGGEKSGKTKQIVTGKVVDQNGFALPGVGVSVRGTSSGIVTNKDGAFTIPAEPGSILNFNILGYTPDAVTVGANQPSMTIKLVEKAVEMQGAVITGMFNRDVQTYTGAATTYSGKELKQAGHRNLVVALSNIDPSFKLVENNLAGSNPNNLNLAIQIRGNNNLPIGAQLDDQRADLAMQQLNLPLIILDGFEITLEKMLTMNENEVESITILKDASATAIYGSRGTNGIVVITSVKPAIGKLRVSYGGTVDIENPSLSSYNLLNAKEKLDLEYRMGYYDGTTVEKDLSLKRYYNYLLNEVNSGVDTYWLSQPTRTGVGQRHNIRMEGGDGTFRYSASFQVGDIQGVMKGSFQRTYNGDITLMYSMKKFKMSNNLMISEVNSENSPYGSFLSYTQMNPYWRAFDEAGRPLRLLGDPGTSDYTASRLGQLPLNPLFDATLDGFDKRNASTLTNNTSLEWNIIQGLTLRGRFGITKYFAHTDVFRPANHSEFMNYIGDDIMRKGWYKYGTSNGLTYNGSVNVSYSKIFNEKHSIFAGLDANARHADNSSASFKLEGFQNRQMNVIGAAAQYAKDEKPFGENSTVRAMGLTGNVNYSYNNLYFVDASLRLDGSSQFGSHRRFAPFWSFGAGWNVQNEAFMANQHVVERLKLRASVGITGSQNFPSSQAEMTYVYQNGDRYYSWSGATLKAMGNEYLRWQQTKKYNIGMDAEFLKGVIKLGADVYLQRTDGLVSSVQLPASNGFSSYTQNVGSIENRGYELRLTGMLIRNAEKGINWSITGTAMHNQNKILKVSQVIKDAQAKLEKTTGVPPMTSFKEGYSTSSIWLVRSLGIDPGTGKELFLGRDGIPTYIWDARDVVNTGSLTSLVEGTISTQFRYKAFSLSMGFSYTYGGKEYNQTLLDKVEVVDYVWNVDRRVYTDRWQNVGDHTAFKALQVNEKTPKTSRFLMDNNTITCNNINLQYQLTSKWITKNLGVEALSFSASMADLFYMSTIKRERGIDYPFSRQFSFGLNVTF